MFYRDLEEERMIEPIASLGIRFTLSLAAYALIALWYVTPRLSRLPLELAPVPSLWVHAFRIVGGTILAPGAVGPGVPTEFREMIGYGDLATAALALLALLSLRRRLTLAIALVWVCVSGRDARHGERDHPIHPLQRVHVSARCELGHRDHVDPGLAGQQPSHLLAAARSKPLGHDDV
jgi:hypothetical protein